ncbi:unnamed protein product [Thelazia callipaeda]|uniref:Transcription factor n=1 Tax=Thelazia callipaeda TaxID=103827 RepID=A0A0N5DB54_THECL|nr:unnamed protein product [Thelazia callipaeda]
MLRQLLSSANGTASSNYDHCSTLPLTSRYSENSTMLLPTSPVMQSSLIQQQQPLPVHQQQQQPPTVLQQQPHTANLPTQNHQFREWIGNDKNLATLENMSLAGYSMQSSAPTNNLGIADANNDLNGTTELFSSTYAMLSADNVFSWNFWDEQSRFSQNANEMQLSMNRQDFGYPVHTTAPGCSSNTRSVHLRESFYCFSFNFILISFSALWDVL